VAISPSFPAGGVRDANIGAASPSLARSLAPSLAPSLHSSLIPNLPSGGVGGPNLGADRRGRHCVPPAGGEADAEIADEGRVDGRGTGPDDRRDDERDDRTCDA